MLCAMHGISIRRRICSIVEGGSQSVERCAVGEGREDPRSPSEVLVDQRRTIVHSSKRCCGGVARECLGANLPDEFGPWKTVFNRFDRWSKNGRSTRLLEVLRTDVDAEWHSIDATINRAHQHAAGGKGGLRSTQSGAHVEVRRPKSTSLSTLLGLPIAYEVSEGQRGDAVIAPRLTDRVRPRCLLGDKAYDTNVIREQLASIDCVPVLASHESRVRRCVSTPRCTRRAAKSNARSTF